MTTAFVEDSSPSLALTTIFTPPSSCRTHWTYEASLYNDVSGGLLLQNAVASSLDTSCFPPGFTNNGRQSQSQIYSPGHCPAGYITPAQYLNGDTTTLVCCQNSFTYSTTLTTIDNYDSSSIIFAGCISTYSGGATTVLARNNDVDASSLATVLGPLTMWGQPIEVAFQQKDLSLYTTTTPTITPSNSARPAAVTATPLPSSSTTIQSPSNTSTLSTGAKTGIGIGGGAIALMLLVMIVFLLWRRKRRQRTEEKHTTETFTESKEKDMFSREAPKERAQLSELDALPSEIDSSARVELPAHNNALVAEM